MKKILLSIAAVAAMAVAVPAMAQPFDHGRDGGPTYDRGAGYGDINQRIQEINFRIDRGARDGSLDRREVRRLRSQLWDVQSLERRYSRGGLNGWERADLNARLDRLSSAVRGERHDGDTRGDHRGDDGRGGPRGDDHGPR